MGKGYPYYIKGEKETVAIIHTYGATAIFILFYNDQNT